MSNVFNLRNCLVYLNYTYSVFNLLISGGEKSPRYLNKPVARSVRFFSACMTFYYYQAMKVNGYNYGKTY